MRSILGKCIAIAMMAAIAIAWQSPPAQADDLDDARDNRNDVRKAAGAAQDAADDADKEAKAADDDAEAADDAAADAETAKEAAKAADDDEAAEEAADAAEKAASEAREQATDARAAADVAQTAADGSDDEPDPAENDAKKAEDNADLLYDVARVIALPNFGLGDDAGTANADGIQSNTDIAARYIALYGATPGLTAVAASITAAADEAGSDLTAATPVGDRDDAIEEFQEEIADQIKTVWLEGDNGAEGFKKTAEDQLKLAEDAATEAAAQLRIAIAVTVQATTAAASATAADKIVKDKEYADAVAAAAADPTDTDKAVEVVKTKQAAEDAAKAAEDAAKAAEEYNPTPVVCEDGMMLNEETNMCEATPPEACEDGMMRNEETGMCEATPEPMAMVEVTANGVGNLLKFGFWTTTHDRDTLLAVTNPGYGMANVNVKIADGMGMSVATFTICLSAGDVWTAGLMSDMDGKSMLKVVNSGNCASSMPPADMLPLDANHGFIEAYTTDGMIMGIANIVSPMGGFSSIYNAVSIVNFDPMVEMPAKAEGVQDALAMEGGIQKDMLIGRWAATPSNGARTHVVLTFPAGGGPGTTPVRIHVTDQDGLSGSRDFMLGGAVNLCTFMTMDGSTTLSCNGGSELPLSSMGGWFKIMSPDMMGFPVIGMVSTVYDGSNGNFDQTAPIQWMEMHDMDDEDDMDMDG